jgi:sarcosine oxidase
VTHCDVLVVGAGGVGSATLYHLAQRGVRVIGIDRFPPGHDRGSSHGETRIIRLAYFEDPNYVPLLRRAYQLWGELEADTGLTLFHQVGLLMGGRPDGELIPGVLRAAREHDLPVEQFSIQQAQRRFPAYRLADECVALFEQRAGYLMVEDCVQAHAKAAIRSGAKLHTGITVYGWKAEGDSVIVQTSEGIYSAARLVVTAGAWVNDLLPSLGISFQVLRKPLYWYRTRDRSYLSESGCPCFLLESLGGVFYGFPQINDLGVKVAEHTGGEPVDDPLRVDRTDRADDRQRLEACLAAHLPGVSRECSSHKVCLYTMSTDGHFVIGRHPEHTQVVFTAGLSGHGFKFTSVLGEIMAQLAVDGESPHEIQFLAPNRFDRRRDG